MTKVIYTNKYSGRKEESAFKTEQELEQHKIDFPKMYDPEAFEVEYIDSTKEEQFNSKLDSDTQAEILCIRAYKVLKIYNRTNLTKESLAPMMADSKVLWLMIFLLGGSPDLALGVIQQLDLKVYPSEIILEVTELLTKAVQISKGNL